MLDWATVIYNFFHGDPHQMPKDVGELTLTQYIVLGRSKKEKDGSIAANDRQELMRLEEFYRDNREKKRDLEHAEQLYILETGDYCDVL